MKFINIYKIFYSTDPPGAPPMRSPRQFHPSPRKNRSAPHFLALTKGTSGMVASNAARALQSLHFGETRSAKLPRENRYISPFAARSADVNPHHYRAPASFT